MAIRIKNEEQKNVLDSAWNAITKENQILQIRHYLPLVNIFTSCYELAKKWQFRNNCLPPPSATIKEKIEYTRIFYKSVGTILWNIFFAFVLLPFSPFLIYLSDLSLESTQRMQVALADKEAPGEGYIEVCRAHEDFRNDEEFMKDMIARDRRATKFLGSTLMKNEQFNRYLAEQYPYIDEKDPGALGYASDKHRSHLLENSDGLLSEDTKKYLEQKEQDFTKKQKCRKHKSKHIFPWLDFEYDRERAALNQQKQRLKTAATKPPTSYAQWTVAGMDDEANKERPF